MRSLVATPRRFFCTKRNKLAFVDGVFTTQFPSLLRFLVSVAQDEFSQVSQDVADIFPDRGLNKRFSQWCESEFHTHLLAGELALRVHVELTWSWHTAKNKAVVEGSVPSTCHTQPFVEVCAVRQTRIACAQHIAHGMSSCEEENCVLNQTVCSETQFFEGEVVRKIVSALTFFVVEVHTGLIGRIYDSVEQTVDRKAICFAFWTHLYKNRTLFRVDAVGLIKGKITPHVTRHSHVFGRKQTKQMQFRVWWTKCFFM